MNPLDHFEFSQSSLQDYTDCRRRFQLRYLLKVAWPAVQAEPIREFEEHMRRGERFHRLAQQYLLGIPEERLTRIASADSDEHLLHWWEHFLTDIAGNLAGRRRVEAVLSAPFGAYRLVAKYDLVLFRPDGRVMIYDWKTAVHRPKRPALLQRMQTRVYPFLLIQAGESLNEGSPVSADRLEFVYWFADPEMQPERMEYSSQRYAEDEAVLNDVLAEIGSLKPENFTMTGEEKNCRFCVYRSLCDRGTHAGAYDQEDGPEVEPGDSDSLDFNFEQIGEIGY